MMNSLSIFEETTPEIDRLLSKFDDVDFATTQTPRVVKYSYPPSTSEWNVRMRVFANFNRQRFLQQKRHYVSKTKTEIQKYRNIIITKF